MKLSGWILGAALAASLAACGGNEPATTTPSSAMPEATYVAEMHKIDFYNGAPTDKLRTLGQAMCELFDPSRGGDPATLWSAAVDTGRTAGLSLEDAGVVVIHSVATYCPQEFDYLPAA